eukprot:CAMPEP_0194299256 /NCGR_PEP_ID=MMETSP0169-20130528/60620_1 /TAXON_ID=218684 /ORGANISM="Corethron pennatum, Strain L29A3" /LENGTH=653 /DNA_ID=CAMNT_0039049337 /DNA_START=518 /DNA_END=2479 /DNA_ORIENTATION=+
MEMEGIFQNQPHLEESLVNEYKLKQFVGWGVTYRKICFFFLLLNVGAAITITGARFSASLCAVMYAVFLFIRLYADKLIEDKKDGRVCFGRGVLAAFTFLHVVMLTNDDLTNNQTYKDCILVLVLRFMFFFYLRVSATPDFYRRASIAIATICLTIAPCCNVFGRYYEPLLFLFAMLAGEVFGHTIDQPHLTIYLLTQIGNIARIEEEKEQTAAAESIIAYQELAMRQRIEREKAEKEADSMLNHNLKNIMADGIASVELYELSSDSKNLKNAKLSMKRGMAWTRRRQSLIMVCDKTYQLQNKKSTVQNLVFDCISGREIETDFSSLPPDLLVKIDPMLVGLALENGVSNAIKHTPTNRGPPRIICELANNNGTSTLNLIIQNKATPGASFISKERERELFQCGTHGRGIEVSSDGIGLGHAVMAATALDGRVSLRQLGDTISYTLSAPVEVHHHIIEANKPTLVKRPVPQKLQRSSPPTKNKPQRGMFIDDSKIARKFADRILMPKILKMQNWIVLGETPEQVELSIPMALAMDVDIVIIDENLDYEYEKAPANNITLSRMETGSQVCASMIEKGVDALFCIRSGNTSQDDVKKYIKAGAHIIICKSFNNQELATPLFDGFRALQEERSQKASNNCSPQTSVFPILLVDEPA